MFTLRLRAALRCTHGPLEASIAPLRLVAARATFSISAAVRNPETAATEVKPSDSGARIPLSIQANYYEPLRRTPTHGLPVCDLQLRSYSVRNLEFVCDFALRAAYFANLPASGPVPLPKRIERWTVPRGNFVHKKSQENFERITYKRLIQIKDGSPETVELWLAFLKKHQYYGVGMKANVWGWDKLGVGKEMNVSLATLRDVPRPKWAHFGPRKVSDTASEAQQILNSPEYKALEDDSVTTAEQVFSERTAESTTTEGPAVAEQSTTTEGPAAAEPSAQLTESEQTVESMATEISASEIAAEPITWEQTVDPTQSPPPKENAPTPEPSVVEEIAATEITTGIVEAEEVAAIEVAEVEEVAAIEAVDEAAVTEEIDAAQKAAVKGYEVTQVIGAATEKKELEIKNTATEDTEATQVNAAAPLLKTHGEEAKEETKASEQTTESEVKERLEELVVKEDLIELNIPTSEKQ